MSIQLSSLYPLPHLIPRNTLQQRIVTPNLETSQGRLSEGKGTHPRLTLFMSPCLLCYYSRSDPPSVAFPKWIPHFCPWSRRSSKSDPSFPPLPSPLPPVLHQPKVQSIPILHVPSVRPAPLYISTILSPVRPPALHPCRSLWSGLCSPALFPEIPPVGAPRGTSHLSAGPFSRSRYNSNLSRLLAFLQEALPNYTPHKHLCFPSTQDRLFTPLTTP